MAKLSKPSFGSTFAQQEPLFQIFVHYGLKPHEAENPLSDSLQQRLEKDLQYLNRILQPNGRWQGYAFVFIDRGWRDILATDRQETARQWIRLGARLAILKEKIDRRLRERIGLVTAVDLDDLVDVLDKALPAQHKGKGKLWRLLMGERDKLLYDAPKVIEAAIRIANIGRDAPVLRFDDDVIFSGTRADDVESAVRQTRAGVERLCEEYRRLTDDPEISYFVFSGGYLDDETSRRFEGPSEDLGKRATDVCDGINGFATRALQLAERAPAYEWYNENRESNTREQSQGARAKVVDELLEETPVQIKAKRIGHFVRGLDELGASPFLQVISGAGLCLSDGAILDLPPFSNMRQNVVWIDDHLKYSLHHELRHFGFCRDKQVVARVVDASFTQNRHEDVEALNLKDARWHVRDYLPRLVLGCVADAWLRADPLLKRKLEGLDDDEFKEVFAKVPGAYAKDFFGVVVGGWPDDERERKTDLEDSLWKLAAERLRELVDFFKKEEFEGTFLELFTTGPEQDSDKDWQDLGFFPSIVPEGLEKAVEDVEKAVEMMPKDMPGAGSTAKPRDTLPPGSLTESVQVLIEDFLEYLELCSFWRHFVFSVRSLLNWKKSRERALWLLAEPLPNLVQIVANLQSEDPARQKRGGQALREYVLRIPSALPKDIEKLVSELGHPDRKFPAFERNPLLSHYIPQELLPSLLTQEEKEAVLEQLSRDPEEEVRKAAEEALADFS